MNSAKKIFVVILITQCMSIGAIVILTMQYMSASSAHTAYLITITILVLVILLSLYLMHALFKLVQQNIDTHKKKYNAFNHIFAHAFTGGIANSKNNEYTYIKDIEDIEDELAYLVNKDNPEKSELVSILNAIKEGILVLSTNNSVMYYNNSFMSQFSIMEKIRGRDYREVIDIPAFSEFVQSLNRVQTPHHSKEITYNNRIFLLSASISKNGKIFVIIFHDVSEARALEKIKKDFVINASHELRTPLTSIKGFLELAEKEPDNNLKYIEIISRNTERIINIINDLLKLSQLESTHSILNREEIDINDLILNNLVLFEQHIKDKALTLSLDLAPSPFILPIDKLKIEEVIINLVDNAIKYTETGSIHISSKRNIDTAIITIKDTGIGIPEKYHSRIFERFFVVDKARSRKTGGTGLGLAIAKHIIQLHRGNILVNSSIGKGTEFNITLPLTIQRVHEQGAFSA